MLLTTRSTLQLSLSIAFFFGILLYATYYGPLVEIVANTTSDCDRIGTVESHIFTCANEEMTGWQESRNVGKLDFFAKTLRVIFADFDLHGTAVINRYHWHMMVG